MVLITNTNCQAGISSKEVEAIDKLRGRVKDLMGCPIEDHFLIRWLRARNFDVKKAEEMLRNYVEWRSTNTDLQNCLNYQPPEDVVQMTRYKITGFDYEGRPVIWLPIGRWEVRKLFTQGLRSECFKTLYRVLEELATTVESQRKRLGVNQFVVLADSAELTFWKLAHYETIEAILRFFREFEAFYPELLHSCYIVNNPMVFSYIFNIVKPLISANTLSKVQMFDYNQKKWKSVLLDNLPAEAIPEEYGGTGVPVLS